MAGPVTRGGGGRGGHTFGQSTSQSSGGIATIGGKSRTPDGRRSGHVGLGDDLNEGHRQPMRKSGTSGGRQVRASKTAGEASSVITPEQARARFQRRKLIRIATHLFNRNPGKSIKFMAKVGLIPSVDDFHQIARFLRVRGVNKKVIGEFIAKPKNRAIALDFLGKAPLAGQPVDLALRAFLSGYQLCGESGPIDYMMGTFAELYLNANPGSFRSLDSVHVLAYALIMLQVSEPHTGTSWPWPWQ